MPAGGRRSWCRFTIFMVALACDVAAAPSTRPHHRLDVTLSRTAPHIRGTVETTFTNRVAHSVDALVFVLFANRFASLAPISLLIRSMRGSMTSSSLVVLHWTTTRCRRRTPCDSSAT